MTLEKQHRQALLTELEKAKYELEIARNGCNSQDIKPNFEIMMFLAQQRIELIVKSLVENEIDF